MILIFIGLFLLCLISTSISVATITGLVMDWIHDVGFNIRNLWVAGLSTTITIMLLYILSAIQ